MATQKYQLTQGCRIVPLPELSKNRLPDTPEVQDLLAGNLYVLDDNGCWYLINPTIKAFLAAFEKPSELDQIITHFAGLAGCRNDEIRETMTSFFQDMKEQGLLSAQDQQKVSVASQKPKAICRKGQRLGDYRIIRPIFKKPELEIYLAEPLEKSERVAIKVLRIPKYFPKKELQAEKKAFLQEFHLMQELQGHPHICQCHGFVDQSPYCYGVMEYIEGKGLRSYIKKQEPTLAERLQLISQILSAMAFVHRKQILHGDIHLSNFIVENSSLTIKLIDFNLSNRELPHQGEVIREGGVFQYIPPEKLDNRAFRLVQERSDYRSEVYQLGIVLYYVLYQCMPFDAFGWQALSQMILQQHPTFPATTPHGELIPAFALAILKKCLKKDPAARYSSATTLSRTWQKRWGVANPANPANQYTSV